MERVLKNVEELESLAKEFVFMVKNDYKGNGAILVRLYGDLGAGKTTFVKSVARVLGVLEHVTSPTFVLQKTYNTNDLRFKTLIHIDAYRIESEREVKILKLEEKIEEEGAIIFVEWPQKIEPITALNKVDVSIEHIDPFTRKFIFKTYGKK